MIELSEGIDSMQRSDSVLIDFENGIVRHKGNAYHFPALPKEILGILEDGGLIPHVKKVLGRVQMCDEIRLQQIGLSTRNTSRVSLK